MKMNSDIKNLTILFALIVSSVIFSKDASAQQTYVSFQVFYDQLSPYGQWVDYPNYGYVWIPDSGTDFIPYSTSGHWVLTDYGWMWVSDYDWGWAPFHYGRWDYDNFYGWFWVPDNEWGPAWVTWRRAEGYYGWEPMAPGVSVNISLDRSYNRHNDHWMFVRDRDIERSDINRYYVNRTDHDRIIRNSTVINKTYVDHIRNTTYVSGPSREEVQKVTGRSVNSVIMLDNNRPGQSLVNGQLRIYRPQVKRNNDANKKPTPSRITNLKDVKRTSGKNATNESRNINVPDNNRKEQQPGTVKISNNNNKAQPAKPGNVSRQNNTKTQLQPNTSKPVNTDSKSQPAQPQKLAPSDNNRRVYPTKASNVSPQSDTKTQQQPNTSKPANTDNKLQPVQSRSINPANNNRQERQTNTVKSSTDNKSTQPKEPKSEKDKKKTE
jgi:hypothetical protein